MADSVSTDALDKFAGYTHANNNCESQKILQHRDTDQPDCREA
jgi:hypothetical protein